MAEPDDDDLAPDGKDYIYRGADEPTDWRPPGDTSASLPPPPGSTPPEQPAVPHQPATQPQYPAPPPFTPPPGAFTQPETPKRKKWPWIVGGLVLFCGLPLGGCVALIGFGINEVNERSDEIGDATEIIMQEALEGDPVALADLVDGGAGCAPRDALVQGLIDGAAGSASWNEGNVAFVERNGNSYLSNVSEPEGFVVTGRESDSTAQVRGELSDESETRPVQLTLLKTGSSWRLCGVDFAV